MWRLRHQENNKVGWVVREGILSFPNHIIDIFWGVARATPNKMLIWLRGKRISLLTITHSLLFLCGADAPHKNIIENNLPLIHRVDSFITFSQCACMKSVKRTINVNYFF